MSVFFFRIPTIFFLCLLSSSLYGQITTSEYDFEGLTLGAIHGQDNWNVESSHSTVNNGNVCPPTPGTELGPTIVTTSNSGIYIGSQSLSCINWNFGGQSGCASRVDDGAWSLPNFIGEEYLIAEWDFHGNWWGKSFFLGFDTNGDSNFSDGCNAQDPNELSIGISTSTNNLRLHDASGNIIVTVNRPSEWCRYRLFADLEANGGQGAVSVCYRELTNNGNWIPLQGMQGINVGFDPAAMNQTNVANLNGMAYFQNAGGVGSIDNISISSINYDVNDTSICQGENVVIGQSINGATYLWNDGSTAPTINVTQTGTYTVTVILDDCFQFTRQMNVTVSPFSDAGVDNTVSLCESIGNVDLNSLLSVNVNGIWTEISPPSGQFDSVTGILSLNVVSQTVYAYEFETASAGCPPDTALITVTVNDQPNAGSVNALNICNGQSDQVMLDSLLSLGVSGGTWSESTTIPSGQFSNGVFSANGLSSGDYTFDYILTALLPCLADTAQVTLSVIEHPNVSFVANDLIGCAPFQVQFENQSTGTLNSSCSWDFGNGQTSADCNNVMAVYEMGGMYDVSLTVTNNNMCASSSILTDYIEVYDLPVADFTMTPLQVFLDDPSVSFTNNSINAFVYNWSFGNGENSSEENPSYEYFSVEPEEYEVVLTVANEIGCVDSTAVTISILDNLLFYVPNAFTPDGDEHNQTFKPIMTAGFDPFDFSFEIYNRWGQLVFVSHNPDEGWDGTFGGRLVQPGMYAWKMILKSPYNDKRESFHGHLSVLK